MLTYTIGLNGLETSRLGLPGPLVHDLIGALERGVQGAVRLRLEGRSSAGGPPPGWLNRAATFDVLGFTEPRPGLVLRAPSLVEALPERFEQTEFFASFDVNTSGVGLLAESLDDALRGRENSDAFDEGLLRRLEEFASVFAHGVESFELRNGRPGSPVVEITPGGLQVIERLHERTPAPRRVRVAGGIDAIRHSDRAFTLVLQRGEHLRGVLAEGDPHLLAALWGRTAVVSGMAHFKPSGALLRVDAEHIEIGSESDVEMWAQVPTPLFARTSPRELRRPQGPRTGLSAIIGKWPGDESDEEIATILEELS